MTTIEKAVRVNVTKWDWAPLFKSSFFLELLDKSPIKCTYGAVQCVVGRLVLKEKNPETQYFAMVFILIFSRKSSQTHYILISK